MIRHAALAFLFVTASHWQVGDGAVMGAAEVGSSPALVRVVPWLREKMCGIKT